MIIKADEEKLFRIFSVAYEHALPAGQYCTEHFDKNVGFYEKDLIDHRKRNGRGFYIDYINNRYMKLSADPIFNNDDTIWKIDHKIRIVQDEVVEDWATELKRTWDGPVPFGSSDPTCMMQVWYILVNRVPINDYYVAIT